MNRIICKRLNTFDNILLGCLRSITPTITPTVILSQSTFNNKNKNNLYTPISFITSSSSSLKCNQPSYISHKSYSNSNRSSSFNAISTSLSSLPPSSSSFTKTLEEQLDVTFEDMFRDSRTESFELDNNTEDMKEYLRSKFSQKDNKGLINESLLLKELKENPTYSDPFLQYNICHSLYNMGQVSPTIIKAVLTQLGKHKKRKTPLLFAWAYKNIRDQLDIDHYNIMAAYYNDIGMHRMANSVLKQSQYKNSILKFNEQSSIEFIRSAHGNIEQLDLILEEINKFNGDSNTSSSGSSNLTANQRDALLYELFHHKDGKDFDRIEKEYNIAIEKGQVNDKIIKTMLIGYLNSDQAELFKNVWMYATKNNFKIDNDTIGAAINNYQRTLGFDAANQLYTQIAESNQETADSEPVVLAITKSIVKSDYKKLFPLITGLKRRRRLSLNLLYKMADISTKFCRMGLEQCLLYIYGRSRDISPQPGTPTLETFKAFIDSLMSINRLSSIRFYLREMYKHNIKPDEQFNNSILCYYLVLGQPAARDLKRHLVFCDSETGSSSNDPSVIASHIVSSDDHKQKHQQLSSTIEKCPYPQQKKLYQFLISTYVLTGEIDKAIYYYNLCDKKNVVTQTMKYWILAHYTYNRDQKNMDKWTPAGSATYHNTFFNRILSNYRIHRRAHQLKYLNNGNNNKIKSTTTKPNSQD